MGIFSMVNRCHLTPEFVDSLQPPETGEIWIADTHQKGFGLRAWAGKNGGGKAYALRLRDINGKLIREVFTPNPWNWRFDQREKPPYIKPLGFFLPDAREWARDRTDILKGRLTRQEKRAIRRELRSQRALAKTLNKLAEETIADLRKKRRQQAYVDSMYKLFWRYIPNDLKELRLIRISSRRMAHVITNKEILPGNARKLRAFIGQIYKRVSLWSIDRRLEHIQRRIYQIWSEGKTVPYPKIKEISEDDFKAFFQRLETETVYWRQALALRLYFATGARLSRILAGQWRQIIDSNWYPYLPNEKKFWFEGCEHIHKEVEHIFSLIRQRLHEEIGPSEFFFPSDHGMTSGHIMTVQPFWRRVAKESGWQGLPLSHVVRRYKRRNNPGYSYWFSQYYGSLFKESLNADRVSKMLKRRQNILINSDNYGGSNPK